MAYTYCSSHHNPSIVFDPSSVFASILMIAVVFAHFTAIIYLLSTFQHQSITVEPFNLWPTGNCGHVYSASHTQAKRHISGWAMRNTNNHNINILKKSCLGVLVCNRNCRKSDGNVVAVRPAICDKARRKQISKLLN